jgi:3-oxoacyl-[acyl-carrier-protein] synthase-3
MPRSIILGTGSYLPDRIVTNDELSKQMDTTDEWIRQRTGIQERRWVTPGTIQTSLAVEATRRACEMAKVGPEAIDAIVYATSTPDHFAPGNGVYLQEALGVLVVGAEIQSTGMHFDGDGRNTAVIFADGAAATLLGLTDDPKRGIKGFDLHSEGKHAELLWVDAPGSMYPGRVTPEHLETGRQWLQMDGKEVFRHAVTRMPESVMTCLAKTGEKLEDLKLLVPHQANLRISEMIQKGLKLRDDQVVNNIQKYGNTTAATIPLALDEVVRAGRLKEGDLVVFTAFGSGFAWGSAVMRW